MLDTNVLSEMMRAAPAPAVSAWVSAQPPDRLFTTSVSQAEILSGLAVMPVGRRRLDLQRAACAMFAEDFAGRVLPFDDAAAVAYADIFEGRRRAGLAAAMADLMIAAVARVCGGHVVTRNICDFDGSGVELVNPWGARD